MQPVEFIKYNATNSFPMEQFLNISGSIHNSTEIEIEIPPTDWNLTHLDLEFTNISINQEKVTIEDLGNGFRGLENGEVEALAMQLRITEFTTINSIDIFGYKFESNSDPGTIYFEITDWDSGDHEPVAPIYGTPVELNMSTIPQWYTQTFPEPIELPPGDYGIVIDGQNIKNNDYYYWWINNSKPGSDLYMTEYSRFFSWAWREDYEQVFLHKLDIEVDKPYFPSEINFTANVNGVEYTVADGSIEGEGSLTLNNTNFEIGSDSLIIPLSNNDSMNLNFNLNYSVNLYSLLSIDYSIEIGDLFVNQWYLNPELDTYSSDYYYKFKIPENWNNVQVFKDGLNISSDVNIIFENHSLTILHDIITEGANWEIFAENAPKNFTINLSNSEFQPAQDLTIDIEPPHIGGKLGFIIQDATGSIIHIDEKSVSSSSELFHYLIRSDAVDGIWRAYVYWFNDTDAGFTSVIFTVNIPIVIPPPDPLLILLLVILGGVITGGVIGTYSTLKLRKSKKEERKQRLIKKYKDLMNLDYIIVTDKISSLDLYSQSFRKMELDLSLVSGFLNAIRSFGIELTGSSEQSQVIKLEYQDSKIIMSEYKLFRIILIMKENPSSEFLESLKLTTIETDEKFGRFLKEFKGDVRPFQYIERLLIQRLETSFLYPLKLSETPGSKLRSNEKDLLKRVKKHLISSDSSRLKISYFIDKDAINPVDVKLFSALIKKRILQPITEEPLTDLK